MFSMGFSAALREELALKGALLALTLERVGFTCLFFSSKIALFCWMNY